MLEIKKRIYTMEINSYTIEATGQGGWTSYRYQYCTATNEHFGYAETEAEALEIIKKAGL